MGALTKITLASDTADGRGGLIYTDGPIIRINIPDNSEVIAASAVTAVDLHETLTLPDKVAALLLAFEKFDIAGTASGASVCCAQLFTGTTAASVACLNFSPASANTPTAGLGIGVLLFIETCNDLKSVTSGFL